MKTIVLATDFSKGSRKAAQTAAQVALKTDAKLVLFHAYRYIMPYDTEMSALVISGGELEKNSISRLKGLKSRLKKKYSESLDIEVNVKNGLVVDALKEVLGETNADLLVMGSVGDSTIGTRYFGSIATSMIHKTSVPLLLVPPKTKFSMFSNAVLGLDFSHDIDEQLLNKTVSILRDLDAVVNLFTISDESDYAKASALKIRELLVNVPHTFTLFEGGDFTNSILEFANENKADLIITFPRKHNFFERYFIQSNTETLALNEEIPILSVI
jgi:nucleotide-binding universal stress UspA family protein